MKIPVTVSAALEVRVTVDGLSEGWGREMDTGGGAFILLFFFYFFFFFLEAAATLSPLGSSTSSSRLMSLFLSSAVSN